MQSWGILSPYFKYITVYTHITLIRNTFTSEIQEIDTWYCVCGCRAGDLKEGENTIVGVRTVGRTSQSMEHLSWSMSRYFNMYRLGKCIWNWRRLWTKAKGNRKGVQQAVYVDTQGEESCKSSWESWNHMKAFEFQAKWFIHNISGCGNSMRNCKHRND